MWRRRFTQNPRQIFIYLLLCWEALWPALGWAIGLIVGFLTVASFDLLPRLNGLLHLAVLVSLIGALAAIAWMTVRRFRWPDEAALRRRLESDSGVPHRPLQALRDTQAIVSDDPLTAAFWAAHRNRMAQEAAKIGWARPRDVLLDGDPYGVRAILILTLTIGFLVAGVDFWPRVGRALSPQFGQSVAVASGFDLWLTPPEYTGLAPLYLGSDVNGPLASGKLAVPAGSTILAQVHGGRDVPDLSLDGKITHFVKAAGSDYAFTGKFPDIHRLIVSQGGRIFIDREITPVLDQPPSVNWVGAVQVSAKGAMRLSYAATDDYGIESVTLQVAREGGDEPVLKIKLPASPRTKDIKASVYQDLTGHPWAGKPVELSVVVQDSVGQTATTERMRLTLPERIFTNPVAKEIIAQRQLLLTDPASEPLVVDNLTRIAERPDRFGGDLLAFLGLRTAAMRLIFDRAGQQLPSIEALLWDTALRIEDGQTPEAQKALREAQQALRDALDKGAPNAEIEALTQNLQQAIQRYLAAMADNARKNGEQAASDGSGGKRISAQDIQKMLDQARDLAKTGSREAAKDVLAQLQDMLESLKMGGQGQGQGQGNAAARQALDALQNLSRQQQQVLDRSYQAARGSSGDPRDAKDSSSLANAQEALRRRLNDVMQQLGQSGQLSPSVGKAEQSMRSAADSLRQSQPTEALTSQGDVLRDLQQAKRDIAEKMREQEGDGGQQQGDNDPFGRSGNTGQNGDVKLPATGDVQRSREILDELRKRASERLRPKEERDYIDRLLERF